jgi:signal transduction histidine kinase
VTEVLEHESLTPTARKHLTLVHKNTERMLRLVNQILDFRKIENRKMKLLLERTDVIILLERVMDNFRLIAEEKHIDFRLHSKTDNISGWIDQDKFEKVMFNLISNAFKYTPDHKSIAVWVSVKDETLVLSVKDEGIGIDLKKQQSLFQRFETLVRYNILQPSSGIGLSLVRELVELHQGSIEVNSQPEVGSEFLVTYTSES